MNRKLSLTHNTPHIFLAAALIAVIGLVFSLARPYYPPVPVTGPQKLVVNKAQQVESARLEALANSYTLQRSRQAEALRLTGLASSYFAHNGPLSQAEAVEAARWTGMAILYGAAPGKISPQVQLLLAR